MTVAEALVADYSSEGYHLRQLLKQACKQYNIPYTHDIVDMFVAIYGSDDVSTPGAYTTTAKQLKLFVATLQLSIHWNPDIN